MTFTASLLDPAKRPQVVAAIAKVLDEEVSSKSGLSGIALKGAYASAKKAKEGIVDKGANAMLPDVAAALQPYWEGKGDQSFAAHLTQHKSAVADALLKVVDDKAANPDNATLAKIYKPIRGKAKGYVEEALPKLGAALEPFVS